MTEYTIPEGELNFIFDKLIFNNNHNNYNGHIQVRVHGSHIKSKL